MNLVVRIFSYIWKEVKDCVYEIADTLWNEYLFDPDFNFMIRRAQYVLRAIPHEDPNRGVVVAYLGHFFYLRFLREKDFVDLDEAIIHLTNGLALLHEGHPDYISSLNALGTATFSRFEQKSAMTDLENAIKYLDEALQNYPPEHPNRPLSLTKQATALYRRFKSQGRVIDLDNAIICRRAILQLCPKEDDFHLSSLYSLGDLLSTRFALQGNQADIEEAIACMMKAVHNIPQEQLERSISPDNIQATMNGLFLSENNTVEMDERISWQYEALQLYPSGDRDRPAVFSKIGDAHLARYMQTLDFDDLDAAVTNYNEALVLRPPTDPDRCFSLRDLGGAVFVRYTVQHNSKDIEDAINCHREALELSPPTDAEYSSLLYSLGADFLLKFLHNADDAKDLGDLKEAIESLLKAQRAVAHDHPVYMLSQSLLSKAYIEQYHSTNSPLDATEAFHYFAIAAEQTSVPPLIQFEAAIQWVAEAQKQSHESLLRAYSTSLGILDRYVMHSSPDVVTQRKNLLRPNVVNPLIIASNAAACAIEKGDLEAAVELSEQGRSIFWSRMRGYRTSLDKLREVNEELADKFVALSKKLEESATSSLFEYQKIMLMNASLKGEKRKYQDILTEWEVVVEEIRGLEGFSAFLKPNSFSSLHKCAQNGPVIIINISDHRCGAIIIHANLPLQHIPLPDITLQEIDALAVSFWNITQSPDGDRAKGVLPILRTLWDLVVGPIVEELEKVVSRGSRIWWCPTSYLCNMPLHAAGPYRKGKVNLPDLFVSSYTPTLASLITALNPMSSTSGTPDSDEKSLDNVSISTSMTLGKVLLAVGQPATPGENELPLVEEEFSRIQKITKDVSVLLGEDATQDAVVHGLHRHPWVHFSCHGHLFLEEPFISCFSLHNSRLTLLSIMQQNLRNAEFAFLSACHSAGGDPTMPDETLHLAAGLQHSGFRSVVGTMWAMVDLDGPTVVEEFYKHMFDDDGKKLNHQNAAKALNLATKELRKGGVPLDRWINFIHVGA